MKKSITCCCLACFVTFLTGCILVSSEKRELSKESHTAEAPAVKPAGTVSTPPVKESSKGSIVINISTGDEDNFSPYEWAELYLDDNFIGSTGRMQLSLEPGQHKITVKAPGYKPYEKIFTILPARADQRLNILLEKE